MLKKMKLAHEAMMTKKENNKRDGMTIIEIGVVLIIAGVIAIAVFAGYNKLYLPTKADGEYKRVVSVISGAERARNMNGNVFIASAGEALNAGSLGMARMERAMGGGAATRDVADWTYTCAAGSGVTVTVLTTAFDSQVVADLVADLVNSNNAPWTADSATANDGTVTFTKPNSVCRAAV